MEATAKATYVRISPRKVQIVLDLIRNQPVDKAMAILQYTPKAACEPVKKVLKSAMANAENNNNMDVSRLVVNCRTDYKENPGKSTGQSIQNKQENITHHHYR